MSERDELRALRAEVAELRARVDLMEAAKPKPRGKAKVAPQSPATWAAYSEAYRARYRVEPVRNAHVNGQLAMLVQRVGADDAPAVAAFYLQHNRADYVRAAHPASLLLRDAEGLRTQWASGRRITDAGARADDRTQAVFDSFAPLIEQAREREGRHHV